MISAHWEALRPTVTSADAPSTVHDFSGWPQPLYALRYSYGSIGMACHAFGGAETDELFSLAAA